MDAAPSGRQLLVGYSVSQSVSQLGTGLQGSGCRDLWCDGGAVMVIVTGRQTCDSGAKKSHLETSVLDYPTASYTWRGGVVLP